MKQNDSAIYLNYYKGAQVFSQEYVTAQLISGAIGGFLGAARNLGSQHFDEDSIFQKIISILIGTVFGVAAAEYFTSDLHPILSLIVGLAAGGVGGVALDIFQSTFPTLAAGILQAWADRIGAGEARHGTYKDKRGRGYESGEERHGTYKDKRGGRHDDY